MNAAVQWLDQIINIFVPLSVSQVMTWASHMIGCGFILGWNLVSLLVEFLFLPRVYQLVPQLAVKPQQQRGGHFQERQHEAVNIQGEMDSQETTDGFINKPETLGRFKDHKSNLEGQQARTTGLSVGLPNPRRWLCMCREGWEAYDRCCLPGRLGLGLPLHDGTGLRLHHHQLRLHPRGRRLPAEHPHGPVSLIWPDGHHALHQAQRAPWLGHHRILSSWLHGGCLTLCVFSVFAPGSLFDLAAFSLS
ncbi:solute carrier family 40 member 1-like [Mirounga leonina]|uniref:solute carrier family 40 member 1-like n=1 Tax=Mirounga leonina TaxID=9715 RepID=UPI00156C46CD|nr:solute carrier family 40 member 1-like [Mirounga leonina]